MSHVNKKIAAATYTPNPSPAGAFGTGSSVDVSVSGVGTLVTYYVVIFGDVNGDNSIDAIDAFTTDKAANDLEALEGSYFTAADINGTDAVDFSDYAVVKAAVGGADIPANG
jgi:hypothetical protein